MIWVILYIILLYVMISSALLAGRRRGEASFFEGRAGFFAEKGEMEEAELSC